MKSEIRVGCIWCAHPCEPCPGENCDHYQPYKPWFDDVMRDEKYDFDEDFFENLQEN